ncbi:MAG TPA: hypothetical protein DCM08_12565 [Microscillaceae bacterium]|nr:hypothetical protein [Microscillaceae bacterium]
MLSAGFFFLLHSALLAWLSFRFKHILTTYTPFLKWFYVALVAKIVASIAQGLLYQHLYGAGDVINLFREACHLSQYAWVNPARYWAFFWFDSYDPAIGFEDTSFWDQPRALAMIKLLSCVAFFTGQHFWLSSFYLSVFSLAGTWWLVNQIAKINILIAWAALFCLHFYPSTVFWSSGLLKENLALGCISVVLGVYLRVFILANRRPLGLLALGFVCLGLLWIVKFYYAGVLMLVLLAYRITQWLVQIVPIRRSIFQILVGLCVVILLVVPITSLHPTLRLDTLFINIIYNHNTTYLFSADEDLIHYSKIGHKGYINLHNSWQSFLYNAPEAWFSGLFRPLPWEASNKLAHLAALENIFWLCATLAGLVRYGWGRCFKLPLMPTFFLFLYVSLLATLLALSSPNFGSLVRYRVSYLPFGMMPVVWIWLQTRYFAFLHPLWNTDAPRPGNLSP